MRLILPLLLTVLGIGAGLAAGIYTGGPDAPEKAAADCPAPEPGAAKAAKALPEDGKEPAYVKLSNQFIVPVVRTGRVASLVILSLSIETESGQEEAIFSREPKLRDVLLQQLFDHANRGGFDGAFTSSGALSDLRRALLEAARGVLGDLAHDVLITEIARQDS